VDKPNITYASRPGATTQTEISALANVYRFVLDSANRNAAGMTSTNGGDAKEERSRNDPRDGRIIPQRP